MAEKSGSHHAPGDGFAVLIGAVICDGLEGVAKSVAEIQDFAEARFTLVAADDMRLDFERTRNDVSESGRIAAKDGVEIFFEKGEEIGIGDDTVFDDLGEAATELAFRKGLQ
jgi:hypothetical protein